MARILSEGFELKDFVPGNHSNAAGSTLPAYSTASVRSGAASWKVAAGNNGWSKSDLALPSSYSEFYIRFGVNMNYGAGVAGTGQFKWFNGATELGSVRVSEGGYVSLYTGTGTLVATGTTLIVQNTWYLIEVHVTISTLAGVLELKVEGKPVEATFNGNTNPGTLNTVNAIELYGGLSFCLLYYDDIAINDTSTASDNSWCGDGHIIATYPTGTSVNQLTGSDADKVNNHLHVDEQPQDGDTTYVEGSVVDEEDLYSYGACGLATTVIINRIWAESRTRDTVAAGGKVALITKASGGAEVSGSDITLTTSFSSVRPRSADQLLNPVTASAWVPADIDAILAGPRTRG